MGQRAPTVGQIAVAVAFAFSCFGLLLFLWVTFGGPDPAEARGLPGQGPVQRGDPAGAGVRRPHPQRLRRQGQVDRPGELRAEQGPGRRHHRDRHRATRRSRRTPGRCCGRRRCSARPTSSSPRGTATGRSWPEGATLPRAQVQPSVQLDEIFRTFDAKTRAAFQTWMQQLAIASAGRGADLNAAIANLPVVRGGRQQGAARARHPAGRRPAVRARHRRGVRRPQRAPGPAAGPDPELRDRLPHDRRSEPGPRGHVPRAAHLPRRVEADPEPARRASPATPTR